MSVLVRECLKGEEKNELVEIPDKNHLPNVRVESDHQKWKIDESRHGHEQKEATCPVSQGSPTNFVYNFLKFFLHNAAMTIVTFVVCPIMCTDLFHSN